MSEPSTTTILSTSRSNLSAWCVCLVLTLLAFAPGHAEAADKVLRKVAVAEPYLEMHTGPGRGYPIFHVVDRGDQIEIDLEPGESGVAITARVVTTARTGAELEALTACSTAALALYDMVKAVERGAVITDLRLEAKSGGASGDYRRS